jgi:hypothetical protein
LSLQDGLIVWRRGWRLEIRYLERTQNARDALKHGLEAMRELALREWIGPKSERTELATPVLTILGSKIFRAGTAQAKIHGIAALRREVLVWARGEGHYAA